MQSKQSEWGLVWGRRKRKSTPKKRMYQLITREKPISSESSATTQVTTLSWIVSMWSERWSQVPLAIFVVLLLHKSLFESDLGAYCRHDCTWFVGYLHGGRGEFSWNACSIRASVQGPFEKASPRSCPEIGVGAGKMTAKRLKNHANHWHMNKLCYGGVHDNDTSWDLRSFLWATTAFYQTSHRGFHCWRGLCRYTTKEKVSAVVHGQPANMELCHAILTF